MEGGVAVVARRAEGHFTRIRSSVYIHVLVHTYIRTYNKKNRVITILKLSYMTRKTSVKIQIQFKSKISFLCTIPPTTTTISIQLRKEGFNTPLLNMYIYRRDRNRTYFVVFFFSFFFLYLLLIRVLLLLQLNEIYGGFFCLYDIRK